MLMLQYYIAEQLFNWIMRHFEAKMCSRAAILDLQCIPSVKIFCYFTPFRRSSWLSTVNISSLHSPNDPVVPPCVWIPVLWYKTQYSVYAIKLFTALCFHGLRLRSLLNGVIRNKISLHKLNCIPVWACGVYICTLDSQRVEYWEILRLMYVCACQTLKI